MVLTNPRFRALRGTRRPRRHASSDDFPAPTPATAPEHDEDDLKRPSDVEDGDKPIQFPQRDWSFWLALVVIVAPIYLVTALSWGYTIWTTPRLFSRSSPSLEWWEWALFGYCVFELLSRYVRSYHSRVPQREMHELQLVFTRVLQTGLAPNLSPTDPARPQSPAELVVTLNRDDPRAVDFRNHFRLWFWGAAWRDITRQSMRKWLSYAVFDKPLERVDNMQRIMVEESVLLMEKRCGGKLSEEPPEGKDHIQPMVLTSDPVNIWSRPGILYVVGELVNRSAKWYLEWKYGMVEREFEGIDYLIRDPSPSTPPTQSPLVLMHGLGFGVAQYLPTVLLLMKNIPSDRPILIPLQPNISQAILHPTHVVPLSRDQWVNGLKNLFQHLRWDEDGVTMVSHSKGSYVHTWMLKAYPELIQRSCFVDPVCFCLWEGDLAYNFVYRSPTNAIELIIKYFAATEPGIAMAVQRHFDWAANSLWFEEIPQARDPYHTSFFIGGNDAIIDGWRARRYLMNHGISEGLHWDPKGQHGHPIFNRKDLRALKAWLTAPPPEPPLYDDSSDWDESEDEVLDYIIPNRA